LKLLLLLLLQLLVQFLLLLLQLALVLHRLQKGTNVHDETIETGEFETTPKMVRGGPNLKLGPKGFGPW